jgi:nucleoside-diphosphate-sugar epimerase
VKKQINMKDKTALVAGAAGVIGSSLIKHLESLGDWNIIALSRRGGPGHIPVNLLDIGDSKCKLGHLNGITHIFYSAYIDKPTWIELVPPNLGMLTNLVDAVEPHNPDLKHISLMQGYKVYGAHYGPFKTPARETDADHMPPEFNIDQQQFLEHRQQGSSWTWSALRPSVVGGTALGNPMNLALVIAMYVSISKELNLPLRFPGKPGAYRTIMEMTDAGLLAKATVWAATTPAAANQAFNVSNGDLFRWEELWPKIARYFQIETAPPLPMPLKTIMADKGPLYKKMQEKYGLKPYSYEELSSWGFGDFVFSWDYDFFGDGSKLRKMGFNEYVDTEKMFYALFDKFKTEGVIPG